MSEYRDALIDLIAYCQREGVLSNDRSVIAELADILDWNEEIVEADLFDQQKGDERYGK